jgi:hypothetical protein
MLKLITKNRINLCQLTVVLMAAINNIILKNILNVVIHVKWIHCHHGMVRPWVADRDGHQIWRVAANILNKQPRTADSGWSSSLGVGRGANNPPP